MMAWQQLTTSVRAQSKLTPRTAHNRKPGAAQQGRALGHRRRRRWWNRVIAEWVKE